MKIVAIVITYNPDTEQTERNCLAYIDYVDKLIIWENTVNSKALNFRVKLSDQYASKVIYMGDGENHCIAYPLNRAVKWAKENGYTHLLTMDQDSLFEKGNFDKYINLIKQYSKDETIGIYGVNPNNGYSAFDESIFVNDTITSGTIYNLRIFDHMNGGFREDFAIDGVDYEMSYKAKIYGFKTIVFGGIQLKQEYGILLKTKFGFYTDNYSPFRLYHIIRNHIVLWREYPQEYTHKRQFMYNYIIARLPKIILAEDEKIKKMKAIFWGLIDGFQGRMKTRKF